MSNRQPIPMKPRRTDTAVKPAAKPTATAAPFPLRVTLVFSLDGEPSGSITLPPGEVVPPTEPGQGVELTCTLDARKLAVIVGSIVAGQQQPKPAALWVPGMPR